MNNIQSYKVDGALFHVMEGEIFGLGGSGDFVKSLYSAVKMLESDAGIVSVELISERRNQSITKRGFGPITEAEVMLNDPFQLVLALILVIIIMIFEELK